MDRLIYMDNAATTPVHPEVYEAMKPYFSEVYSNPSAVYTFAGKAGRAVDDARQTIASVINAKPEEVYFTAGGSESDNWAIIGAAEGNCNKGKHIITTRIEHHAVLNTCKYLEKHGFEVTYLDVDKYGRVSPEDVENAIRPDTILISVMTANNEIGSIQPIEEIGGIAKDHGILFHTDAVQAMGHIQIDVEKMNIDMLSASAHKLNGPKGVGLMYIRKGIAIPSFIHGGAQERGRRAGTLNVPGIVGFATAARMAEESLTERNQYVTGLRDYFNDRALGGIDGSRLNGDRINRLPNNVNLSFPGINGETLLILLDQNGICASSGSACSSGSLDPSHVLTAIGLSDQEAGSSLRFTLSEQNTRDDVDYTIDIIKKLYLHMM